MIQAIQSDSEAESLRPGSRQELCIVLFVDPELPACQAALEKLRTLALRSTSAGARRPRIVAVDVVRAPQTAAWYGVQDAPALAAVFDAALLAIEYECSEEAAHRLMQSADEQLALLEGL